MTRANSDRKSLIECESGLRRDFIFGKYLEQIQEQIPRKLPQKCLLTSKIPRIS